MAPLRSIDVVKLDKLVDRIEQLLQLPPHSIPEGMYNTLLEMRDFLLELRALIFNIQERGRRAV